MNKLNTIFIMSYGRPNNQTANYLTNINYEGEFYICCQEDEPYLNEYIQKWGSEKIITYDYYSTQKETELLDNFGFEKYKTGAVVARNCVKKIAEENNLKRYWCFDDDITAIKYFDFDNHKWRTLRSGKHLEKLLNLFTNFAHKSHIEKLGFQLDMGVFMPNPFLIQNKVIQIFNFDVNHSKFMGRVSEDSISSIQNCYLGKLERCIPFISYTCKEYFNNSDGGGLTNLYSQLGKDITLSYILLYYPNISLKFLDNGKVKYTLSFTKLSPKIIKEEYSLG